MIEEPGIKFKSPSQVIDVMFFQGREANSWRARIHVDGKKFYIGPAHITNLMANVSNFMRGEALYADARVHEPEALTKPVWGQHDTNDGPCACGAWHHLGEVR